MSEAEQRLSDALTSIFYVWLYDLPKGEIEARVQLAIKNAEVNILDNAAQIAKQLKIA